MRFAASFFSLIAIVMAGDITITIHDNTDCTSQKDTRTLKVGECWSDVHVEKTGSIRFEADPASHADSFSNPDCTGETSVQIDNSETEHMGGCLDLTTWLNADSLDVRSFSNIAKS